MSVSFDHLVRYGFGRSEDLMFSPLFQVCHTFRFEPIDDEKHLHGAVLVANDERLSILRRARLPNLGWTSHVRYLLSVSRAKDTDGSLAFVVVDHVLIRRSEQGDHVEDTFSDFADERANDFAIAKFEDFQATARGSVQTVLAVGGDLPAPFRDHQMNLGEMSV